MPRVCPQSSVVFLFHYCSLLSPCPPLAPPFFRVFGSHLAGKSRGNDPFGVGSSLLFPPLFPKHQPVPPVGSFWGQSPVESWFDILVYPLELIINMCDRCLSSLLFFCLHRFLLPQSPLLLPRLGYRPLLAESMYLHLLTFHACPEVLFFCES